MCQNLHLILLWFPPFRLNLILFFDQSQKLNYFYFLVKMRDYLVLYIIFPYQLLRIPVEQPELYFLQKLIQKHLNLHIFLGLNFFDHRMCPLFFHLLHQFLSCNSFLNPLLRLSYYTPQDLK